MSKQVRSSYTVKNPHRDSNLCKGRWTEELPRTPIEDIKEQFTSEQLIFEYLNRKCTCGSGDIWSECNGIDGTSSYCG